MLISQYTLTREISIYQVQLKIYKIFSDLLDALCFKKLSNRTARQLCFTGHIIFGCNIRYKPLSYLLKPKTDRKKRDKKKAKQIYFALLLCFSPDFCFFFVETGVLYRSAVFCLSGRQKFLSDRYFFRSDTRPDSFFLVGLKKNLVRHGQNMSTSTETRLTPECKLSDQK